MKKTFSSYKRMIIIYIALALFLGLIAGYYFANQGNLGKRTGNLVGDGVCGNFASEADQNTCCAKAHERDITIECVGNWEYVSGMQQCQFVCEEAEPSCLKDLRTCSDGSTVGRNASNECLFDEC